MRTSKAISSIFHPVTFLSIIPFLVIYKETGDITKSILWTVFSFLFVFFGILAIILGLRKKYFSDGDLYRKEERFKFLIFVFVLSAAYFVSAYIIGRPSMVILGRGILIGSILATIITLKFKISLHMAAVSAFSVSVYYLYGLGPFLLSAIFVPIVAWSRLNLKKHSAEEVATGTFLGASVVFFTLSV